MTRRITQIKVPVVMQSLNSRRSSVALESAGAFVRERSAACESSAIVASGPLPVLRGVAVGALVRLSLLIAILLGLITAGCGPPV